jgi:hypothetical protein
MITVSDKFCSETPTRMALYYYVTMKRVRATIVAVEKQYVTYSECVFVDLGIQQALHCHLWPTPLYNIFPHYLINGAMLEKNIIERKVCVLIFSIIFV